MTKQSINKILVTGGLGNIGTYVVAELMEAGYEVIISDLKPLEAALKDFEADPQTLGSIQDGIESQIRTAPDEATARFLDKLPKEEREEAIRAITKQRSERNYQEQPGLADGYSRVKKTLQQIHADQVHSVSLSDTVKMRDLLNQVDAVCHLAAIPNFTAPSDDIFENNIKAQYELLKLCSENKIKKFVMASSIMVYGFWELQKTVPYEPVEFPSCLPVREEMTHLWPREMYDLSKLFGEMLCHSYYREQGLSSICLRLCNAVSTKSDGSRLQADLLWGKGALIDIAKGFLGGIETDIPFGSYNIGSKHRYGIDGEKLSAEQMQNDLELTKELVNQSRKRLGLAEQDLADSKIQIDQAYVQNALNTFSIAKAEEELGYNPKY